MKIKSLMLAIAVLVCSQAEAGDTTFVNINSGSVSGATTFLDASTYNDDIALQFGTGGTVECRWETADANANALVCTPPEGGATDVPVFVWGDASAENVDLGLFNGITAPMLAVLSDDQVSAVKISHDQTNAVIDTTEGSVTFVDPVSITRSTAGSGLSLSMTSTAYTSGAASAAIARTGNLTGVNTEALAEFTVVPVFTLTEPGAGTFTYYGSIIDLTSVTVTPAAGAVDTTALMINGSESSTGTNYAIHVAQGTSKFDGLMQLSTSGAVTASTTQTQGNGALTKTVNNVSVCANPNDTVTLPAAAAGLIVYIFNNGAQTLQVFPASGDAIDGAAADAAVTQAAGTNLTYIAHDDTNWNTIHSPL